MLRSISTRVAPMSSNFFNDSSTRAFTSASKPATLKYCFGIPIRKPFTDVPLRFATYYYNDFIFVLLRHGGIKVTYDSSRYPSVLTGRLQTDVLTNYLACPIRFTTTFIIVSFSSGRLSAMSRVRATSRCTHIFFRGGCFNSTKVRLRLQLQIALWPRFRVSIPQRFD